MREGELEEGCFVFTYKGQGIFSTAHAAIGPNLAIAFFAFESLGNGRS